MLKEPADKHETILKGGTYDADYDTLEEWLIFLTDLANLKPGLPELTVYHGVYRENSIKVTYHSTCASLRSFKLELETIDDTLTLFQETNPEVKAAKLASKSGATNPDCHRDWILNLFDHSELEELRVPFKNQFLPDHFDKIPKLKIADFNGSNLQELPPSFYQLPALEHLVGVQKLSPAVANLPLRSLDFTPTPQQFSSLKNLTELTCSQIDYVVPDEIDQLVQLKSLHLAFVSHASTNLLNLAKLERLTFWRSQHSTFRFSALQEKLPNLKELHINSTEAFVDILGHFKNLEKLTINDYASKSIQKLEVALTHLHNLKYLFLEGLGFTNLDWCVSLLNLEYLHVGKNSIERIPLGFGKLQKLKTIILNNNPITTIPELPIMPSVTWIDLQYTKIPDDENAPAMGVPIQAERLRLKRIFPNVKLFAIMESSYD
ncbi:MAG: leucine-rich repeat domain-containing protein [Bacteroidetes bacterium CHB5]|nr:leucine-rich repeat domain-containing protein [Bacteroidetes bacterium CHB5]